MPLVLELYSEVIQKQLCFLGEVSVLKNKIIKNKKRSMLLWWVSMKFIHDT